MSPKSKSTKPIDIYIRVSRVNGRDVSAEGMTASEQERRCRAQLDADGLKPGKIFQDLDESGAKSSRPAFDEMLARIKSGKSGGVIVLNLSRLTRAGDLIDRLLWFEQQSATFISVEQKVDTSTATGRLIVRVLDAINAMKVDEAREQFAGHKANFRARGGYVSARVPFGFVRNGGGELALAESEAEAVREIYRMRNSGASWTEIVEYMGREGHRTPGGDMKGKTAGGNRWTEGALRKLVENPIYKGSPRGDNALPAGMEPIVSGRVWSRAQPTKRTRPMRSPEGALLSGLLRCSECGGVLTAGRITKNAKSYQTYRCRQRAAGMKCPTAKRPGGGWTISGNLIEPLVLAAAHQRFDEIGTFTTEESVADPAIKDAVEDARFDFEEFMRVARPSDPGYAERLAELRAELAAAQAAYDEAPGSITFSGATEMKDAFDWASVAMQHEALTELFKAITVRPGTEPIEERVEIEHRKIAA